MCTLLAHDRREEAARLAAAIEGDERLLLAGAVLSADELLELAANGPGSVVVVHAALPGAERALRVLAVGGSWPVLVLVPAGNPPIVLRALDLGALGVIEERAGDLELRAAVLALATGAAVLSPQAARTVLEERRRQQLALVLTPREREVLGLLTTGRPNKAIARQLTLSEKTVKVHLSRIYRKLGVDDRTQAALWARAAGATPASRRSAP